MTVFPRDRQYTVVGIEASGRRTLLVNCLTLAKAERIVRGGPVQIRESFDVLVHLTTM